MSGALTGCAGVFDFLAVLVGHGHDRYLPERVAFVRYHLQYFAACPDGCRGADLNAIAATGAFVRVYGNEEIA